MKENNIFKVLADKQRRDILIFLREGSMSAGDIAQRLDITPAALSYHLRLLKECELVSEYRQGNFIIYELNTSVFDELIMWISQFGGEKNEKAYVDNGSPVADDNGSISPADA